MLIIGFDEMSINASSPVVRDIQENNIGGVILFDLNLRRAVVDEAGKETPSPRNIASPNQVKALTASLQSYATTPLFITIDQEGGYVARLNKRYGFPSSKSHQYLGAQTPSQTYTEAFAQAKMLQEQGINFNFAPVIDIAHEGNFITKKERCFSNEPSTVTLHAAAFIQAYREVGILTSAKHFPGHGSSMGDSHLGLVDVSSTWSSGELIPYQSLQEKGLLDAVMTAHIYLKQYDAERPASLSPAITTGLLREEIGFNGLIITDDFNMGAIKDHYTIEEACIQTIIAGSDLIIIAHEPIEDPLIVSKIIHAIEQAIKEGRLSASRIDASYERIMHAKATFACPPAVFEL